MTTPSAKRQLSPVPFTAVTLDDPFWSPRQDLNRTVSLPHMYQMLVETGRIGAFDLDFTRKLPAHIVEIFGDSDPAKWLEGACYALATQPDPALRALVDELTDKIISAQQPDGYLNTHFITADPAMKWKNLRDWHEMYCAGHLMEAAVAHHQATGETRLLDALERYADHIAATFGTELGKRRGYGGHPEIELALVRLYHETGNQRHLALAKYLVEERGQGDPHYYDVEARDRGEDPADFWATNYEYAQAHLPIRQQTKVVGHAVRVMYLLCGVADLAHEYDDPSLLETCENLWGNLVHQRMYLTGGIGPSRHNEGFTTDYDLPDESAYAETCASIALIMWNHRLLQVRGEGKYADIIEQTLYNGFISGLSQDGKHFFYVNPLASDGTHHRTPWFLCPCCPPNVGRILASLGNYLYSTGPGDLWVHFYAQNRASVTVDDAPIQVQVTSTYPWDGDVRLTLTPETAKNLAVHLRIPGWCETWQVRVNGAAVEVDAPVNGYVTLRRTWQPGDVIDLALAMPVQSVWAHPAVRQMQGRLAIQRGPMVYCLEGADHAGLQNLDRIAFSPAQVHAFQPDFRPDLLGGVTVLTGAGSLITDGDWDSATLYRHEPPSSAESVAVTAIPYCVWDNRAAGEMRVWFRAE